jgi:hypothetical protein
MCFCDIEFVPQGWFGAESWDGGWLSSRRRKLLGWEGG